MQGEELETVLDVVSEYSYQYSAGHSSYNIQMNEESKPEIEVECPISRSPVNSKRFYFQRHRKFQELKDALIIVFQLDAYLAQMKFYHNGLEVTALSDITQPAKIPLRRRLSYDIFDSFNCPCPCSVYKYLLSRIRPLGVFIIQRQIYNMSRRNYQDINPSSNQEEEAEEVNEAAHLLEAVSLSKSEEEGEDLDDQAEQDYQPIQELDRYEDQGVEDQDIELNPEARRMAEKELQMREKNERVEGESLEEFIEESSDKKDGQRRDFYEIDDESNEQEEQMYIDAQDVRGQSKQWINLERVQHYIKHHFIKFITCFQDEQKKLIYQPKIKKMSMQNLQSLQIDYIHLRAANSQLASWLAFQPVQFIPKMNSALYTFICKQFPTYKQIISECYVKVFNMPIYDCIRDLSYSHLNKLIRVKGVVTSRSEILYQLNRVHYKCGRCGHIRGPYYINKDILVSLGNCYACHTGGPFIIDHIKSVYRNYQVINIQESPSDVKPGRIPRSKIAYLRGDNVDLVKPGEQVQIVGIYGTRYECELNIKQGFPIFTTHIQVNSIKTTQQVSSYSSYDDSEFERISRIKDFDRKFYNSIAPSIFGHKNVKKALAMALFGGVVKDNVLKHRTRGDINVLLIGDPGVAKSQFLKSIQKISYRCIYTTGKGASAVGLTASVKQDSQTNEWKLQAGALVLADKGVCLIDEFDKMTEQDRTSIHEAMEQQTISISKAGIVANLNARCAVIAAANPTGGRYNEQLSFHDNVNLSDPILSRFDMINVIRDKTDPQIDKKLSQFVINQHMKSHPYHNQYIMDCLKLDGKDQDQQSLEKDQNQIKRYIKYARQKYQPKFSAKSSEIIKSFYIKLREQAKQTAGINIATRHLESMIRISEAHARMHLRKQTNEEDAKFSIKQMLNSFIDTQKHGTAQKLKKIFKYELSDF